jgi:hypothetical protein
MLKYVAKLAMDTLPSVVATIIGAYIVNHYIAAKPATDAPVAAAVSSADPKNADSRINAKPSGTSIDVANIPEAGVRAKGISEKAVFEKSVVDKFQEKPADKPAETASLPADPRRHQAAPREKTVAKTLPAPAQPATTAVVPVTATPNTAPAVEAAVAPEEHRDANDLARAAIERLRGANDAPPHPQQEAARNPDAIRIPEQPRVASAPPVRPLPPPIMVSTPAAETLDSTAGLSQTGQPYPSAARIDDPRRPTPPADIPDAQPLDLAADAGEMPPQEHAKFVRSVLSAARSVFHAVLPQPQSQSQ